MLRAQGPLVEGGNMPAQINIRLGSDIQVSDPTVRILCARLLQDVCQGIIELGIVGVFEPGNYSIFHDFLGVSGGADSIHICVILDDDEKSRQNAENWRTHIAHQVAGKLAVLGFSLKVVPNFKIVLLVGGHQTWSWYDREKWAETNSWTDEELELPVMRDSTPAPQVSSP